MRTSHCFTKPGAAATAAALLAALLVQAAPATAAGTNGGSAGVVTIDQAKAETGGVTANDTPGFPVTISQAGTYRLTSNLVVGNPNTTVIEVTADNVTLDLNGYSILGATSCSGDQTTICFPVGTGDGVRFSPANRKANLAISNGTIRGMGGSGINGHTSSFGFLIDNLRVVSNGGYGIAVSGAHISHNVVMRNGNHGIGTHSSLVSDNTVVANGGAGLLLVRSGYGGNSLVGNSGGGPQLSVTESAPVAPNFCNVSLCP
jgi:hypothetical protein